MEYARTLTTRPRSVPSVPGVSPIRWPRRYDVALAALAGAGCLAATALVAAPGEFDDKAAARKLLQDLQARG